MQLPHKVLNSAVKAECVKDEPRISYVGNLGVNRGIVELISALPLCVHNVRLDLCGAFYEVGMEECVEKMLDGNRWIFMGG